MAPKKTPRTRPSGPGTHIGPRPKVTLTGRAPEPPERPGTTSAGIAARHGQLQPGHAPGGGHQRPLALDALPLGLDAPANQWPAALHHHPLSRTARRAGPAPGQRQPPARDLLDRNAGPDPGGLLRPGGADDAGGGRREPVGP